MEHVQYHNAVEPMCRRQAKLEPRNHRIKSKAKSLFSVNLLPRPSN